MKKVTIEIKTENIKECLEYLEDVLDGTGDSFKVVKDKKYKFYHNQPCDCDICYNQKEILK